MDVPYQNNFPHGFVRKGVAPLVEVPLAFDHIGK
jgi:hypothetical protein